MIPTALLSTLGAFALILVLARIKVPLAPAILAGALAAGAMFRRGPVELLRAFVAGAIQPMTIGLVVIVVILLMLSEMMRKAGLLDEIVSHVRALLRRPVAAMAALPAIVGMLPMPGGALFSAPMVASAASGAETRGGALSAVNYWFRHVWEFWWPLYPGVILAMSIGSDLDPSMTWWRFFVRQAPLSVFMIGSGFLVIRGLHPNVHRTSPPAPRGTRLALLKSSASIWIVLLVWLAGTVLIRFLLGASPRHHTGGPELTTEENFLAAAHRFIPLAMGLVVSIAYTVGVRRLKGGDVLAVLGESRIYKLGALVLSVMVFQHVLKTIGAPSAIGEELADMHIPVVLVVAILPFIAGLVTGLAVGFVGTSFPIVLGLIVNTQGVGAVGAHLMLAYAFGHMGQMISPLHLCHVVSNRYFETGFTPVYRRILPAAAVCGALAAGYFTLLQLV